MKSHRFVGLSSKFCIVFVPVALLVAAVEGEGVEEDDGGVVRVLPLIRHRLQVLHQLHHLVVVLHQGGARIRPQSTELTSGPAPAAPSRRSPAPREARIRPQEY